jgi:hypothetical protein
MGNKQAQKPWRAPVSSAKHAVAEYTLPKIAP